MISRTEVILTKKLEQRSRQVCFNSFATDSLFAVRVI